MIDEFIEEYIESLPLENTPEIFGLHSNAEIGYYTNAAKDMWNKLIEIQPQTGKSGSSLSREEIINEKADGIKSKLPGLFDLDRLRKKLGVEISPTTVVLLQVSQRIVETNVDRACLRSWRGSTCSWIE